RPVAGQGRRLCDPGLRRDLHHAAGRQLLRRDGAARARNRGAAAPVRTRTGTHGGRAMSEEILVNVTPRETRVAVVENGMLQELHFERGWRRGVVGNIYKGRVQRVMPGMQAAFVEIGLDRAAFLHAADIVKLAQVVEGEGEGDAAPLPPTPTRPIAELLREGQ